VTDDLGTPAVPPPVPDGPALPDGIEPVPEWGPDAIGTGFKEGPLTFYRVLSIVLAVLAVATLVLFAPAFPQSIWAVVMAVFLVGLLGLSAVNYHLLAGFGPDRPAVVVTADTLEVLVPFNRFSADLAAIRDVTVLSRDLIVLAPGGLRNGTRGSRAKRAVINNARSFEADRAQLANAILDRSRAARGRG
jgi:hypothetical protein